MTGFLDTNILIYAYDPSDRSKQRVARELLRIGSLGGNIISAQVLAEFSSALLHKKSIRIDAVEVALVLYDLELIPVVVPDLGLVHRAVEAHRTYGVHFYDAMIIAAAERGGCSHIWSEDFSPGQEYFGIRVENPFQ